MANSGERLRVVFTSCINCDGERKSPLIPQGAKEKKDCSLSPRPPHCKRKLRKEGVICPRDGIPPMSFDHRHPIFSDTQAGPHPIDG